jgi:hypothetical protein
MSVSCTYNEREKEITLFSITEKTMNVSKETLLPPPYSIRLLAAVTFRRRRLLRWRRLSQLVILHTTHVYAAACAARCCCCCCIYAVCWLHRIEIETQTECRTGSFGFIIGGPYIFCHIWIRQQCILRNGQPHNCYFGRKCSSSANHAGPTYRH